MGRSDQPAPNPEGEPQSVGDRATLGRASDVLGRIDRYELIRELGGGGFGVVFLARDTIAGIEVAVKGLPPLIQANKEELERVRENFALVSRLHHPHIAAPLVLHQARDVWYASESIRQKMRVLPEDFLFVMAYAPGVTLSKWRKQFPGGRVPPEQALAICRQIADALDYAHGERIIHRDIKPSNVMVETRNDGRTLTHLLDFGLAAEIRSSMGRISRETGDTSGTRPYMAPEQWLGKKQGPATDQYAMAVMFHELVTGLVPFGPAFETGDPVIMANVATKETPDPVAELDKKANAVLQCALSKNPAERYASCRAFVDALGGGHSPATAGKGEAGRAVTRAPLAIGIGIALVIGLGFWFWPAGRVAQPVPAPVLHVRPPVDEGPVASLPPAVASKVIVNFLVKPAGSKVTVFDNQGIVGSASCPEDGMTMELTPGHYEVEAQLDGYEFFQQGLNITGALTHVMELVPRRGALTVTTVAGAEVVALGKGTMTPLGKADEKGQLRHDRLVEGTYELSANHADYFGRTNRIDVRKDRPLQVDLGLTGRPGLLYISASPQADVWVDGVKRGVTGENVTNLTPGLRKVEIQKSDYRTESFAVEIPPNHAAPRKVVGDLVRESGLLRVKFRVPEAAMGHFQGVEKRVWVGSKNWEITNGLVFVKDGLPVGKQAVRVEATGYDMGTTIPSEPVVADGKTTDVEVTMEPKSSKVRITGNIAEAEVFDGQGRRLGKVGELLVLPSFVAHALNVRAKGYATGSTRFTLDQPDTTFKDQVVNLEEVRSPVEGQNWTSPATGMEFVWIAAMKLWVGKYEVTNEEYRKLTPGHNSGDYGEKSLNGDSQPVVRVNFGDGKVFAAEMTKRDAGVLSGAQYRLPSEQEWQTFAQCDKGWEYPWGNAMPPTNGNYADASAKRAFSSWTAIYSYDDGQAVSAPVNQSGINPWGLYGVGGNVWEICASGNDPGSFGACRGGSWSRSDPDYLRCEYRMDYGGLNRIIFNGFRLVLSR